MAILKRLLTGLLVSVIIAALILGYFGFVPGLSDVMGANTPRDLGVKATASSLSSANSKLGVTFSTLPADAVGAASLSETGSHPVSATLTSEEVTALLNDHAAKWKYYPIDNIQVRINPDNTIEMSGVLRIDRWSGYADAIGLPESVRSQVRPYLSLLLTNPSIYMKGTLSIQGNVQLYISDLQLGRVSSPQGLTDNFIGVIQAFVQYVSSLYQIQVSQMYAQGGALVLVASAPTNVALSPPSAVPVIVRHTSFWAPSPQNAIEAFGFVSIVYILGNMLRARLNGLGDKLKGLLPSAAQMWVENYISSKSDVEAAGGAGSIFKLTKVELIAYAIALPVLTLAFAYSSSETMEEIILALPVVLATSIVVEFLKNYILSMIARSRGVWQEYRIWPSGLAMFVLSTAVFKTPFSAPSKSTQKESEVAEKISGLLAILSVLLVLLFGAGFYYLGAQGISSIGNIGLGMCLLSAFFDSIPIPPLNGRDVYEWHKKLSIFLLVATFALNMYWLTLM